MADTKNIHVSSQVNSRDLTPGVMLRLGDEYAVLDVATAQRIGAQLLTAAGYAEQEATMMRMLTGEVGATITQAASILAAMRRAREGLNE